MSLTLRIALGDRRSMLAQTFTVASIVALLSASLSFEELFSGFIAGSIPQNYIPLARSISAELSGLVYLWSLPVWAVLVVSFDVLMLHASRQMTQVSLTLSDIGAANSVSRKILAVRLVVISLLGWSLGLSFGLVLSQTGFRVAAIISKTAYYVPSLSPWDVLLLAAMTFTASALGGFLSTRGRRG